MELGQPPVLRRWTVADVPITVGWIPAGGATYHTVPLLRAPALRTVVIAAAGPVANLVAAACLFGAAALIPGPAALGLALACFGVVQAFGAFNLVPVPGKPPRRRCVRWLGDPLEHPSPPLGARVPPGHSSARATANDRGRATSRRRADRRSTVDAGSVPPSLTGGDGRRRAARGRPRGERVAVRRGRGGAGRTSTDRRPEHLRQGPWRLREQARLAARHRADAPPSRMDPVDAAPRPLCPASDAGRSGGGHLCARARACGKSPGRTHARSACRGVVRRLHLQRAGFRRRRARDGSCRSG